MLYSVVGGFSCVLRSIGCVSFSVLLIVFLAKTFSTVVLMLYSVVGGFSCVLRLIGCVSIGFYWLKLLAQLFLCYI